jgi:uncharacterized membrane protein YecN with MAPEG domain
MKASRILQKKNAPMNQPGQVEKVGRTLLFGAMVFGIGFDVLRQVFYMVAAGILLSDDLTLILLQAIGQLFRLAILIFLFIESMAGRNWARWVLGVLYLASAVNSYIPLARQSASSIDMLEAATVAVFLALGVLLISAEPIRAYQAQVREKKGR